MAVSGYSFFLTYSRIIRERERERDSFESVIEMNRRSRIWFAMSWIRGMSLLL